MEQISMKGNYILYYLPNMSKFIVPQIKVSNIDGGKPTRRDVDRWHNCRHHVTSATFAHDILAHSPRTHHLFSATSTDNILGNSPHVCLPVQAFLQGTFECPSSRSFLIKLVCSLLHKRYLKISWYQSEREHYLTGILPTSAGNKLM